MGAAESRHSSSVTRATVTPIDVQLVTRSWSALQSESLHRGDFNSAIFGGALPRATADALFDLFADDGADHISLDDLLVGLAILCKGDVEQRKKMLVGKLLPAKWIDSPPQLLTATDERVESFYEILAGATHLNEDEIAALSKHWTAITSSTVMYRIDETRLATVLCPPLPTSLLEGVFTAMDDNGDRQIDLRDLVTAASAACRGPYPERLKFVYKVIRARSDTVTLADVVHFLRALGHESSLPIADDTTIDIATFIELATNETHANVMGDALTLVAELVHVVLALPPESFAQQRQLALSYLSRFSLVDTVQWMVVSAEWWEAWLNDTDGSAVTPLDNHDLLVDATTHDWMKWPSLTAEGGLVRRDLEYARHYRIVPSSLWTALCRWYGCTGPALPRYVISETSTAVHVGDGDTVWSAGSMRSPPLHSEDPQLCARRLSEKTSGRAVLELHPITIVLLRHETAGGKPLSSLNNTIDWVKGSMWSGSSPYRRVPTASTTFSCVASVDDIFTFMCASQRVDAEKSRLWLVSEDDRATPRRRGRLVKHADVQLLLLEDGAMTLNELHVESGASMLLEVRNVDLTWPEEMGVDGTYALNLQSAHGVGVCGLNNLGNTCYINGAVQALSNVPVLREYLLSREWEKDTTRPHPMTTALTELLNELWTDGGKVVAPVHFNSVFAKCSKHVSRGGRQQDSHEFLNELLELIDGELHTTAVASRELPSTASVAERAEEHWSRVPPSIIVDTLYTHACRAKRCHECERTDTFSFEVNTCLGLSMPPGNQLLFHIPLVLLDGEQPRRYGLRLRDDDTVAQIIQQLCRLSNVDRIVLLNLNAHDLSLKYKLSPETRVGDIGDMVIYAYEEPIGDYRVGVQRRLERVAAAFLHNTRYVGSSFNAPILLPVGESNEVLYSTVSHSLRRWIDSPTDTTAGNSTNRARLSEDAHRYPFVVRRVVEDTVTGRLRCAVCDWSALCIGCPIDVDDGESVVELPASTMLAIDWHATSLHLRYRHAPEYTDDESVEKSTTEHRQPLPLSTLLAEYMRPETMSGDNAIECETCATRTEHTLSTWLLRLPPVLIIQMIRFARQPNGRVVKATQRVDAPLVGLDLAPYVHDAGGDDEAIYDCIAVLNHYGTTNQGHYTTYAKNSTTGNWSHFNDSRVKEVSIEQIDRQMAYLLVYQRRLQPSTQTTNTPE